MAAPSSKKTETAPGARLGEPSWLARARNYHATLLMRIDDRRHCDFTNPVDSLEGARDLFEAYFPEVTKP